MASIEIVDSRLDAMLCVDLCMYPIAPSGEFMTPVEHLLLPRYGEGILAGKFVRNDLAHRFKSMTCNDICGVQTTALIGPFVAAKVCSPNITLGQIQAFAKMVIGPRRLQTPFERFLEAVFGIEHPNEYNGSVFIDTTLSKHVIDATHHFFAPWGGTVVFSNEPISNIS